ncbi:MAG: protein kinase [Nitrospirae bacterium]|nr:protein kinase [Nitrospirota bacterium]
MSASVVIKVTGGKLRGREFIFNDRTTCIVGRGADCYPRLPDDNEHRTISRHHCLLDINPPGIRIRDFGSLNGTFVNGKKIGQRDRNLPRREALSAEFPEYDLKNGDEIKLGSTIFKVLIHMQERCSTCMADIPDEKLDSCRTESGTYVCSRCRGDAGGVPDKVSPDSLHKKECVNCGRDMSEEEIPADGTLLCDKCRADIDDGAKPGVTDNIRDRLKDIGGYTIIKEIGKGGMGAVYLARNNSTGDNVALKVMLSMVAVNDRSREMFLREVENTRYLKHDNVVQLLDYGNSRGTFFFTLEYCDGGAVDKWMQSHGGRMKVQDAAPMILQALDGLDYAHNIEIPNVKLTDGRTITVKGLVHRDIKPSNLFLTHPGGNQLVKIADFGLGKAFDAAGLSGYTRTGSAAGTPVFMSRQQVINFKYSKPETDVWSMAASFYYLLTGRFPRDFPKGKDPWYIVLQSRAVPIQKRNPEVPGRVAEVIDAALIDQPEITFKTAAQFKRELEAAL